MLDGRGVDSLNSAPLAWTVPLSPPSPLSLDAPASLNSVELLWRI